jgi:hypothetical protein
MQRIHQWEERILMSGYERRSGRELTGFIIILIGFALLTKTMGIFPGFPLGWLIQRFWLPALFIGIGVLILNRRGPNERSFAGVFFLLLGAFFLMGSLNLWGWGFEYRRWLGPAILIWIGLAFLMRGTRPPRPPRPPLEPREPQEPRDPFSPPPGPGTADSAGMRSHFSDTGNSNSFNRQSIDSSDFLRATAILGGFNRRCPSQQFRGGDVTAIMGGGKVDLREARLRDNAANIDVVALMGGVEILVPPNWIVESRLTPILGGFVDRTRQENQATQRLIINGTAIMGTITVSN